jgi:hypothetical protein
MRSLIFVLALFAGTGCNERYDSSFHDAGTCFVPIGSACMPDKATTSECGYLPQFYCAATGICASACNRTADCPIGAACIGAGDMFAGECRVSPDGGA